MNRLLATTLAGALLVGGADGQTTPAAPQPQNPPQPQ